MTSRASSATGVAEAGGLLFRYKLSETLSQSKSNRTNDNETVSLKKGAMRSSGLGCLSSMCEASKFNHQLKRRKNTKGKIQK